MREAEAFGKVRTAMVDYCGFFGLLGKKGVSQYRLIHKHKISKSSLYHMKHNMYVNTELIDRLCGILGCEVGDIVEISREPRGIRT